MSDNQVDLPEVSPERLRELAEICGKLDPQSKKTWILEIYDLRDGADVLRTVVDIKTGKSGRRRVRKRR